MKQHVILISSGQPSGNPRLVKEAVALDQAGYKVTVIYVPLSPWADAYDIILFQKHPKISFIRTGYHPNQQKVLYKWTRLRRKVLSYLFRKLGDTVNIVDYSTILFGQELLKVAMKHKGDLYIAHNLGALPVAVKVAYFHKAKVGFDAEDFHRGEFAEGSLEKYQNELIESKYLPQVDYLSVASPLIAEAYKSIFPELSPIVINNTFSIKKLPHLLKMKVSSELTLFWFSQTIGKNRGLELVIKAMGLLPDLPVRLTLLGNITAEMKAYFLNIASDASVSPEKINFLAPVTEDDLFSIASEYDVGIGSEPKKDMNNNIALSNKIFTYLIAGNAIVLSDTKAQSQFLEENPDVGSLYKNGDPVSLTNVLKKYLDDPKLLKVHQQNARELAEKKLNWEIESKKLLDVVQTVLNK